KHSSPPNRTAPAWGSRSVGGSSNYMAAVWGRSPTQDGARLFSSRCRRRDRDPYLRPFEAAPCARCAVAAWRTSVDHSEFMGSRPIILEIALVAAGHRLARSDIGIE